MWQIPVMLRVITAHMAVPAMMKKLTARPSRTRQISLQFGIYTALSLVLFLFNNPNFGISFLLIFGIGIINCFACYAQWRAVDINLSKTALFTQADDIIALSLGYVFLGETKFLSNYTVLAGIIFCVCGALIFSLSRKSEKNQNKSAQLLIWIAIYSLIWGTATFIMRYFAINNITISSFSLVMKNDAPEKTSFVWEDFPLVTAVEPRRTWGRLCWFVQPTPTALLFRLLRRRRRCSLRARF